MDEQQCWISTNENKERWNGYLCMYFAGQLFCSVLFINRLDKRFYDDVYPTSGIF